MKQKNENLQVIEVLGTIRENDKNNWARVLFRGKWFENDPTIEIRNMDMVEGTVGKGGTSLKEEEVDNLVKILIDNDFGTLEDLEAAVEKRKKRFTLEIDESATGEVTVD